MFFLSGKQARFTLNFCSGMPLRKVDELTFLWFGLPGPLLSQFWTILFIRERKISPKFFRPNLLRGRPRGMSVPKCLFFRIWRPDRSFWPDIRRDVRLKASSLGWFCISDLSAIHSQNYLSREWSQERVKRCYSQDRCPKRISNRFTRIVQLSSPYRLLQNVNLFFFVILRGHKSTQTFLCKVFQEPSGSRTSAPKIVDVRIRKRIFLRPRWWGETFWPRGIQA